MDTVSDLVNSVWFKLGTPFLSILLFILSNRMRRPPRRDPSWDIRTATLLTVWDPALGEIRAHYQGREASTLSVTEILFWNAGRETIDATDIPSADPPRVVAADDAVLLGTRLVVANNPGSQLDIDYPSEGNPARITFDYLDPGHGAVFEVVHTLTLTAKEDISVQGAIKGAQRLRRRIVPPLSEVSLVRLDRLFGSRGERLLGTAVSMAFVASTVAVFADMLTAVPLTRVGFCFASMNLFFLFTVVSRLFVVTRTLRNRVPRGLERYDEDVLHVPRLPDAL